MMKFKCYILLVLFCELFYSQNKPTDSLKKTSYEELQRKFYSINNIQIEKAKIISKIYLERAKAEKQEQQIAEGYVMMHFNENLPNALKYLDSLNFITKNFNQDFYPARVYLLRGNLYSKFYDVKSALGNYVLTLEYAKQKGNKRQIAFAEINIAYLNNYIGKHREAANILRHYLYNTDYLDKKDYDNIKVNLADTYIEINKMDSAKALISEGLIFNSENIKGYQYYGYLLELGYYNLKLKKYNNAIDNLSHCKKYFSTNIDVRNQSYTLMFLGQSYKGLKEKEKAIQIFEQLDSYIQQNKYVFPELRDVYPYLVEYYKENKNKEQQLHYIERFLEVDKILDSQFRYISRELPRRYDRPKLLKEKEIIIREIENNKTISYVFIGFLLLSLSLLILAYYRSKKAEKQHKKIARDLLQSIADNHSENKVENSENITSRDNLKDRINRVIAEDVAETILKELNLFETKEHFLKKGITLTTLAKRIKTNSNYLSEIINTHKEKNFNVYLNDLRIDYAISRLAKDKKFRSYKIPFIAEELGYNNEQAFTLAFKKRTGTPLSIYLKEIENTESQL